MYNMIIDKIEKGEYLIFSPKMYSNQLILER